MSPNPYRRAIGAISVVALASAALIWLIAAMVETSRPGDAEVAAGVAAADLAALVVALFGAVAVLAWLGVRAVAHELDTHAE